MFTMLNRMCEFVNSLVFNLNACGDHTSLSSIIKPKNFVSATCGIFIPLIYRLGRLLFIGGPKIMKFVLRALIDKLFALNKSVSVFKSFCILETSL